MRRTHSVFISTSCLAWGFLSPAYRTVVFTIERNRKKTLTETSTAKLVRLGSVLPMTVDKSLDAKKTVRKAGQSRRELSL